MKVAILGYGSQGKSAFEYWGKPGNEITICDARETLVIPDGAHSQLGKNHLKNLGSFDLLIRTPVLHPKTIQENNQENQHILDKVWTNTNEFMKVCPTKNIIGVTGTKGKGTTSTLIAKMLEAAGKRVHLGGNIGIPPLELLKRNIRPDDWVVLELANFQLIDLRISPKIAVCLMVEPEHMDWHIDFDEYKTSKQQLFKYQDEQAAAIYFADNENSREIANISQGSLIPYFSQPGAVVLNGNVTIDGHIICKVTELQLPGEHNWQNVCAATTAVWCVMKDSAAIRKVLTSFSGLPFRIEFRGEKHGVKFYNDSFSTTPETSLAAMRAIKEPKVCIVGGFDRGLNLSGFAQQLATIPNLKKLVVIGSSGERLIQELKAASFNNYVDATSETTMAGIVATAIKQTNKGDAVVLSPGFASFDMFKNFEDRGNQFNKIVEKL